MWTQIRRHLLEFDDAVLTALDEIQRPYSLRCQVKPDGEVLALVLPAYVPIEAGPASLLFHRHNEQMWNLKSFLLRGQLLKADMDWRFQPEQFVPGVGIGGLLADVRLLISSRRRATRYLQRRGLARPRVAWDEFQTLFDSTEDG
ncbi:MAG: hypothetical protein R3300_00530 [Candidatus Promineifilaceae bacterium]|nr:hypothetical protein [Candidatus Promineifilaceae bacterium]